MPMKKWVIVTGAVLVVLIAGYFIAETVVHKKVVAAISALPDSLEIGYSGLHVHLLTSSVTIDSLHGHGFNVSHVAAHGICFLHYLRSKQLKVRSLVLQECTIRKEGLSMEGDVTVDSLSGSVDSPRVGSVQAKVARLSYAIPDADEIVLARRLELDSRKRHFQLDTLRMLPTLDAVEIGRKRGHQTDVVDATIEGITADGIDIMQLLQHRLVADSIVIRRDHIHVFRDRRLPLMPGEKAMPMQSLKDLPISPCVPRDH